MGSHEDSESQRKPSDKQRGRDCCARVHTRTLKQQNREEGGSMDQSGESRGGWDAEMQRRSLQGREGGVEGHGSMAVTAILSQAMKHRNAISRRCGF